MFNENKNPENRLIVLLKKRKEKKKGGKNRHVKNTPFQVPKFTFSSLEESSIIFILPVSFQKNCPTDFFFFFKILHLKRSGH